MNLPIPLDLDVFMCDEESETLKNFGINTKINDETPTKKARFFSIDVCSYDYDYPQYSNIYVSGTSFVVKMHINELKSLIEKSMNGD